MIARSGVCRWGWSQTGRGRRRCGTATTTGTRATRPSAASRAKRGRAWEDEFSSNAEGSIDSTFAAFYEVYEADMRPRLREHTWYTKSYMIEGKILPYFGNMRVDDFALHDSN